MNFKEYTSILKEAKFREAPSPALLKQIKKIAELYYNQYNSKKNDLNQLIDSKKIVSFEKNNFYKEYFNHFQIKMPTYFTLQNKPLGKIKVLDLETQKEKVITVFCIYGDIGDEYAAYSETFETINLYDENIKNLSLRLIESKLLHEITHGFQEYKGTSSRYRAASNSKEPLNAEIYYREPIEYDTHLNEIIYHIREKHQELVNNIKKAKESATKRVFENRLNLFFQQMVTLIIADPKDYFEFEALTLPDYVSDFEDFLFTIKDDHHLWSKFTLKLTNFYQKLTGKDVRGRALKDDELAKKITRKAIPRS